MTTTETETSADRNGEILGNVFVAIAKGAWLLLVLFSVIMILATLAR